MNRLEEIDKLVKELLQEKTEIQNECSHPGRARYHRYGASTGNWDPGSDHYWVDYRCGLCNKTWTVSDQTGVPNGSRKME